MDDTHRVGEDRPIPFRNERYFCSNGEWYFDVRGGGQRGPFMDKQEMQAELLLFIREKAMEKNAITNG